jgi:hypothetical protein
VVEVTATVVARGIEGQIEASLEANVDGRVVLRGVVEVTSAADATP